MMVKKLVVSFLIALITAAAHAQAEPVSVQFTQTNVHQGDSLHFNIFCNANKPLEVYIMAKDSLFFYENIQIAYGESAFHISTASFPMGNYILLVTGEDVRIQRDFLLWKEE
jgi:uncharacterized protein YgiM (DUF1202 family)